MFLDDTACNLASLNLATFYTADGQFQLEDFRHAVRLWTIALEISVLMASFPSRSIAEKSYQFRTLGLGYANLGTVLMRQGIPYDSPKALAMCGAITSIMTGESYSDLSGNGGRTLAVPRLCEEPRSHAAGHSKSPAGGLQCAAGGI